jgi:hypothetical protein
MQVHWEAVLHMERIVEQAAACGILEEDLRFARMAVEFAKAAPPRNAEESFELWHRTVAHGEAGKYPLNSCSRFIAAMAWREAHVLVIGETGARRWWKRREREMLTVDVRPWV